MLERIWSGNEISLILMLSGMRLGMRLVILIGGDGVSWHNALKQKDKRGTSEHCYCCASLCWSALARWPRSLFLFFLPHYVLTKL